MVNIVLKANFKSLTTSVNVSRPEQGGRTTTSTENNVLRIAGGDRWSLDVNGNSGNSLFETERNIDRSDTGVLFDRIGNVGGLNGGQIDPALSALAGGSVAVAGAPAVSPPRAPRRWRISFRPPGVARDGDLTAYRTLSPRQAQASIAGTYKHDLNDKVGMTLSASLDDSSSRSYLGLPGVTLTLPETSPWSPFGNDVFLYRYVDRPDALTRQTNSRTARSARSSTAIWASGAGRRRANTKRVRTDTVTGRGVNAAALQAAISAGRPDRQSVRRYRRGGHGRRARHRQLRRPDGQRQVVLNGSAYELPAGRLNATFKVGAKHQSLDSESLRGGVATPTDPSHAIWARSSQFRPAHLQPRQGRPAQDRRSVGQSELAYQQLSDFGGVWIRWAAV